MHLYGVNKKNDNGTNNLLMASMGNILLCIVLIFIVFAMLYRVQRGVELTDEGWYVAEPYAVAKGAVAFADNLSQAPGFTIPLALCYKIYLLINGSAEGIFLFSRYLYVAFLTVISVITFYVTNKYTKFKVPAIGMGVMMAMGIYSLFDITYNTIGQAYLPLICALIFAEYEDDGPKSLRWGIIAGLIFGRTVIGTPQVLVPCLVLGIYLIAQKKWKRVAGIVAGTAIAAIAVVGYACIAGGLKHFINGLYMFFNDLFYFKIEMRFTFIENCILLLYFLLPAIAAVVFLAIMKNLLRDKTERFKIVVRVTILFFVLLGIFFAIRDIEPGVNYVERPLLKWSWFGILLYDIYSVERTDKYRMSAATVVSLAFFSGFVFSSFTNIYGVAQDSRIYWFYIPLLLGLCLIFNERENNKYSQVMSMTAIILIGAIVVLRMFNNYNYVYRDEKFTSLKTKVEEGVWKGIYTTSERANDVIDLERHLKSITTEEDRVLLLDQVCFAYTMINGQIWSSTTTDPNSYSYNGMSNMLYDYFVNMKGVPTKIIYIDFGWDEQLSIDDDVWGFNDFVLSNYTQADEYENDSFLVKEFVLENEADAMLMAYEKSSALPFK